MLKLLLSAAFKGYVFKLTSLLHFCKRGTETMDSSPLESLAEKATAQQHGTT